MSKSAVRKNFPPKFSLLSWLVRILLYSIVFASVFVPSYVEIDPYPYRSTCSRNKHILKNLLNPAHCNPMAAARNDIGAFNRAQQAYYLENNRFADSIKEVGLGIQTKTYGYSYRIVKPMVPVQDLDGSVSPESNFSMRMAIAQCTIEDDSQSCSRLKNYLGVVYTVPETSASGETEIITGAILCETELGNPLPTKMPIFKTEKPTQDLRNDSIYGGLVRYSPEPHPTATTFKYMQCPVGSKQLGQ